MLDDVGYGGYKVWLFLNFVDVFFLVVNSVVNLLIRDYFVVVVISEDVLYCYLCSDIFVLILL